MNWVVARVLLLTSAYDISVLHSLTLGIIASLGLDIIALRCRDSNSANQAPIHHPRIICISKYEIYHDKD